MWVVPAAIALMLAQVQGASLAPMLPNSVQLVPFRSDPVLRFTVPVNIGGQTRRFLVDTGAEESGISLELVRSLGLPIGTPSEVTGFAGSRLVPTVSLTLSGLALGAGKPRQVLAFSRDAIGADGFLGLDWLRGHVVLIDFGRDAIFVRSAARAHAWIGDAIDSVAAMKVRNARMVFTDAAANGVHVQAILDTGSSLSVGNESLRAELKRRNRYGTPTPIRILSVTGEVIAGEYVVIRNITVGDIHVSDMPIAFAGPEPFEKLGFSQKPALLLGMDILRQFDEVEIDFPRNEVRFTPRGMGGTQIRIPS